MRRTRRQWVSGVGVIVAGFAALLLASDGTGPAPSSAAPPPSNPVSPFEEILDKLDDLKTAVDALSAGGPPPCGAGTAGQRFVVSQDGTEVCDNTTGLNWQKNPDSTQRTHADALAHCPTVRQASRLPEVKELISLLDYSVGEPGPILPPGHPFLNFQANAYWSATPDAVFPTFTWTVHFLFGHVLSNETSQGSLFVWCVRGT